MGLACVVVEGRQHAFELSIHVVANVGGGYRWFSVAAVLACKLLQVLLLLIFLIFNRHLMAAAHTYQSIFTLLITLSCVQIML